MQLFERFRGTVNGDDPITDSDTDFIPNVTVREQSKSPNKDCSCTCT